MHRNGGVAVILSAMVLSTLTACTSLPRDAQSAAGPLPYIAVREPVAGGEIQLTAAIEGNLRIDDICVRFEARDGRMMTPVFAPGTTIGRDRRGVYVRDGETAHALHDGDRFRGGGGALTPDTIRIVRPSTGPVPRACVGPFLILNPGFRRI